MQRQIEASTGSGVYRSLWRAEHEQELQPWFWKQPAAMGGLSIWLYPWLFQALGPPPFSRPSFSQLLSLLLNVSRIGNCLQKQIWLGGLLTTLHGPTSLAQARQISQARASLVFPMVQIPNPINGNRITELHWQLCKINMALLKLVMNLVSACHLISPVTAFQEQLEIFFLSFPSSSMHSLPFFLPSIAFSFDKHFFNAYSPSYLLLHNKWSSSFKRRPFCHISHFGCQNWGGGRTWLGDPFSPRSICCHHSAVFLGSLAGVQNQNGPYLVLRQERLEGWAPWAAVPLHVP